MAHDLHSNYVVCQDSGGLFINDKSSPSKPESFKRIFFDVTPTAKLTVGSTVSKGNWNWQGTVWYEVYTNVVSDGAMENNPELPQNKKLDDWIRLQSCAIERIPGIESTHSSRLTVLTGKRSIG